MNDSNLHGIAESSTLLNLYRISDDDLERIRVYGVHMFPHIPQHTGDFYDWLQTQPEHEEFFSDVQVQKRVESLVVNYWQHFFRAEVDESYVESRRRIGATHARIGLPLSAYFAAMNVFLNLFMAAEAPEEVSQADFSLAMQAIAKLVHLDTAVVVETYSNFVNERMTLQSRSLMEMSTPVTQIWNGILLLPIVGIVDSKRAQDIMNAALAKIAETQTRVFIMDISGVAVVDTAVANHLIKITKATRLMGCSSVISGVSPAIAQTVVELGIDVGSVKTTATMKDALADAFKRVGMEISHVD